jgi:aspartyl protease family protein
MRPGGAPLSALRPSAKAAQRGKETELAGWVALILLVLAAFAIVLRSDAGSLFGFGPAQLAGAAFALAFLIVVTMPLFRRYRGEAGLVARDLMVWAGVAIGAALLYGYRAEIKPLAEGMIGMVAPQSAALNVPSPAATERLLRLRRQPGGHFIVHATINGEAVQMIVDTGATTVVLRALDAQQIGIDTDKLAYTVPVETANGAAFAAPVKLRNVLLGPIGLVNVDALITKPGSLDQSLLGMSFLSRLKSYEFSGDFLSLRG